MRPTSVSLKETQDVPNVLAGNCTEPNRYVVAAGLRPCLAGQRSHLHIICITTSQREAAIAMEECANSKLDHATLFLVMPRKKVYVVERIKRQSETTFRNDFPINETCSQSFSEMMYNVIRNEEFLHKGLDMIVEFTTIPEGTDSVK